MDMRFWENKKCEEIEEEEADTIIIQEECLGKLDMEEITGLSAYIKVLGKI